MANCALKQLHGAPANHKNPVNQMKPGSDIYGFFPRLHLPKNSAYERTCHQHCASQF